MNPEPGDPPEERGLDQGPRPRGLAGLLVWPLQALLLAAVRLAAGLVEGLLRALIPGAPGHGGADPRDDGVQADGVPPERRPPERGPSEHDPQNG